MNERVQTAVSALQSRFGAGLYEYAGEISLVVQPEQVVEVCRALKVEYGFNMLTEQTAVDFGPDKDPHFNVVYRMVTMDGSNLSLGVHVPLTGNAPHMPTVVEIYANANWQEREIYDMFGIRFDGHPDMRRILMPADWEGYPLRKDYPLGYEEVEFTFNVDDVERRKPHPRE